MKYLILITLLSLNAHAMDDADKLFYITHAIDVAQTYQISKSNCHIEVGSAAMLIGENPSTEGVIVWGVATAIGYHLFKDKLPKWAKHINISYRTFTVNDNFQNTGLTVGSHSCLQSRIQY